MTTRTGIAVAVAAIMLSAASVAVASDRGDDDSGGFRIGPLGQVMGSGRGPAFGFAPRFHRSDDSGRSFAYVPGYHRRWHHE
jgi:hypothetical protein